MRAAPRRYRILHPVGKGAFGTVYRAQMMGEGGFHKDVAIKLMNMDVEAPDEVAQRQRDEARLLGLIRHRAILQVDGLVRLNGSWAVVMEYIDGINLRELLRFGPVPPSCALQIIGEVASALRVAWEATGADGSPLRIIHRDIKPPNIQLTRAGEVKLLDFGVARADFDTRETETVGVILGTLRYMAPERLDGIDGPEGDVYALGVVLVELLTRKPMTKTSSSEKRHAETVQLASDRLVEALGNNHGELIGLILQMLAYEPGARPDAETIERTAWGLAGASYPYPRLQEWASKRVPEAQEGVLNRLGDDTLAGETLMEQSQSVMIGAGSSSATAPAGSGLRQAFTFLMVALLSIAGAVVVGVIALVLFLNQTPTQTVRPVQRILLEEVDQGGNTYPIRYRDGEVEKPDVAPAPTPVRRPRPPPAPIEPEPEPEPAAAPEPKGPAFAGALAGTSTGMVDVRGAEGITLAGPKGTFKVPGEVPDGTYDVLYNGKKVKVIRVSRGGNHTIECNTRFHNCKVLY